MMFILNSPIYCLDTLVGLGTDPTKLIKKFNTLGDFKAIPDNFSGEGRTEIFEGGASILWTKEFPETPSDFGVLSHEIFHLVTLILDQRGIKFSFDCDEAYAYYIGFITEQIYKKISKKK